MSDVHAQAKVMNDLDVRATLGRGGMDLPDDADPAAASIPAYDPLRDPAGADRLAGHLADRLRVFEPTHVVVWEEPHDAGLAVLVARHLQIGAIRTWNEEGLISSGAPLLLGIRAVLVADAIREPTWVLGVKALLERHQGTIAAIGVLFDSGIAPLEEFELVALTKAEPRNA